MSPITNVGLVAQTPKDSCVCSVWGWQRVSLLHQWGVYKKPVLHISRRRHRT